MSWRLVPSAVAVGLAVLFGALPAATPVRAAGQYVILGGGSRSCGSWLQLRSQALPDSATLQSWVLGYITSVNANLLTATGDAAWSWEYIPVGDVLADG